MTKAGKVLKDEKNRLKKLRREEENILRRLESWRRRNEGMFFMGMMDLSVLGLGLVRLQQMGDSPDGCQGCRPDIGASG